MIYRIKAGLVWATMLGLAVLFFIGGRQFNMPGWLFAVATGVEVFIGAIVLGKIPLDDELVVVELEVLSVSEGGSLEEFKEFFDSLPTDQP